MPARDSIAKEILQTEESYVAALSTVVNFFVAPLKQAVEHKKTIISSEEIIKIFSNLELLLGINQELLANLRDRIGVNWSDAQCIGSLFIELSPFLKNYAQYCNVFTESNQFLLECMENNPKFKRFLRKQQRRPECKSLDLESFLIMPVQRVPRYVLLLKDFLRHTDVSHPDHSPLTQALAQVELVAASINKSLSIYQNRAKLVFIEQELNIQIGLVQPHRELLREGTIQRVSCRKPGSVKIYVLNDMIILSEDGLYLDRSAIQVVYLMDGEPEHPFSFKLYCPTATSSTEFVFAASSEEERQEWWTFIENTINAYLRVKPSALLQRDKLLQKLEAKRSEEASMSPVERRRKQREEKKQDKKVKLTRDDSKFQTIRF